MKTLALIRLASPFGQPAESRIGEAAKVFQLTVGR